MDKNTEKKIARFRLEFGMLRNRAPICYIPGSISLKNSSYKSLFIKAKKDLKAMGIACVDSRDITDKSSMEECRAAALKEIKNADFAYVLKGFEHVEAVKEELDLIESGNMFVVWED